MDIAKESADIILLKKSLLVLGDGVIEHDRVGGEYVDLIAGRSPVAVHSQPVGAKRVNDHKKHVRTRRSGDLDAGISYDDGVGAGGPRDAVKQAYLPDEAQGRRDVNPAIRRERRRFTFPDLGASFARLRARDRDGGRGMSAPRRY